MLGALPTGVSCLVAMVTSSLSPNQMASVENSSIVVFILFVCFSLLFDVSIIWVVSLFADGEVSAKITGAKKESKLVRKMLMAEEIGNKNFLSIFIVLV